MRRSYLGSVLLVCALSCLVGAVILTGCSKPQEPELTMPKSPPKAPTPSGPSGEPFVIGGIFSVTGEAGAPLGTPEKETAEMVEKKVNEAGGINGRPLKIILEDDASEESKAVLAAKKLVEEDKVLAIVGPTLSGTTMAIVDYMEQQQVPLFSCAASNLITNPVKKWVFSSAQTDVLAVERIVAHLQAQNIKKVAIICDSNKFGQSGAEQLKSQLPAAGVTIVDEQKFQSADTDMTAQLTTIKGKNPEAIICWGTNPGPAVVAKGVKGLGISSRLIMSHGIANQKFIELAGDAAEGVIFPAGKLLVAESLPDTDAQKAVLLQYAADFEAAIGKPANTFGGHAWDALQIVIDALKAGADDRAKLRDAIETTTNFVGISGVFNLSATDHNGLSKDAFTLVEIKGGKWTTAQ